MALVIPTTMRLKIFVLFVSTTIGWIAMKFDTDIHVSFRMNINNSGDPVTFYLAPSSG